MRLKDLETLLWIARLGSFTAAAERLHITQSAITRRVRELETALGIELFQRTGRRVRLTADGRICLDYAQRIVGLSATMKRELGHADRLHGTVRVGAGETVAMWWLPRFVLRANGIFPGITLELDVDLSARHIERFERGALDLLFLPGEPTSQGHHILLDRIQFAWMASPQLGVPSGTMRGEELSRWPVLTLPEPSNSYIIMAKWFRQVGLSPRTLSICNSLMVVAALTAAGMGVALLPVPIFRDKIITGQLQTIVTDPPIGPVPIWIVYRDEPGLPLPDLVDIAHDVHRRARDDRVGL